MAAETTNPAAQVGMPLAEFEAAVETLLSLQQEGKYQIFLPRENAVRLIGDISEFRIALGKKLGEEPSDARKAQELLEEIQGLLQLVLATDTPAVATKILKTNVYNEELETAKNNAKLLEDLQKAIERKVELISTKVSSETMAERSKRLGTVSGPMLEDVDIELISKRRSFLEGNEVKTPFLRIKLRYSMAGETKSIFSPPPWLPSVPLQGLRSFELECDETDVDVLISRLLQAKETLRLAIDANVKPSS